MHSATCGIAFIVIALLPQAHGARMHISSWRHDQEKSQDDAPEFEQIMRSNSYCASGRDGDLTHGPKLFGGIRACEQACLDDPRCRYFSFWYSGRLNYCRTHETCATQVEEDAADIAVYKRIR